MEGAISSKIADYLIKPVNPNQILHSCKKILESGTLVSQKINTGYQQDFRNIGMAFSEKQTAADWIEIYKKLTYWELELEGSKDRSMLDVLQMQKSEANVNFSKFITQNYLNWVHTALPNRPILSPDILSEKVFSCLKPGKQSVFFLLVDCLRYDQWKMFEPCIAQYFSVEKEELYFSILPTATQYARNAIFAGMFPADIAEKFPRYWLNDEEEGGKNLHEADFLKELLPRKRLSVKHSYNKVITNEEGRDLSGRVLNLMSNDLNVVVLNFVDLLAHARTEMNIVKELTPDESAFRSLARSWFEHSSLLSILKKLSEQNVKIILTTDHGTIRVGKPLKIVGDKNTSTNIRYKQGRNLNYDTKSKQLFTVAKPEDARLPKSTISGTYVFAMEDSYLIYPNNYNYYVNFFKDTFQHGGVSMEEMLVPLVVLNPK